MLNKYYGKMVMVTQKGTRERERERELREFLWIKSFWGYTKRTKEKKRERTPSVRYQAYTDYYVRRQL